MSCESSTAKVLRERGLRLTPQRRMILAALRHAGGHRTARELLEVVRREYPFVDASTVYRTLTALKETGLISETDMGQAEATYEWMELERHHHLICQQCGETRSLDDRYLSALGEALLRDLHFDASLDHFAIFGLCARCRNA